MDVVQQRGLRAAVAKDGADDMHDAPGRAAFGREQRAAQPEVISQPAHGLGQIAEDHSGENSPSDAISLSDNQVAQEWRRWW